MTLIDRIIFKLLKSERTFSQSGEDRILALLFKKFGRTSLTYLDIGANHPFMSSNTYLFYRQGAHGVCVEPNPKLAQLYMKERPRDKCLSVGIGFSSGQDVGEFYVMSAHTLSTFSKKDAEELSNRGKYYIENILKVPLVSINWVLESQFETTPDLVSIDVEGWNEEIVLSLDLSRNRPFCFCVETVTFSDDNSEEKLESIFEFFESNAYEVYADTHLNTIFVDRTVPK